MQHKPFEDRQECRSCGKKGYIKICVNFDNNNVIKHYLNQNHHLMIGMDMDIDGIDCYCQSCGEFAVYPLSEKLFVDGIIKEITA